MPSPNVKIGIGWALILLGALSTVVALRSILEIDRDMAECEQERQQLQRQLDEKDDPR